MKGNNDVSVIVAAIRRCFVNFPHVESTVAALDRLYSYECEHEEPAHLFIIGESGVGKSTLLNRYEKSHPRIIHEDYTEIPILLVRLDEAPTPKTLAGILLKAMESPFWSKGDAVERKVQLLSLLRACKVRLVIIDEANHLVDRGGEKTRHNAADWLKTVADAAGISFVLAGIPRTIRLLETNDQLRGRFREVISIDRFSVADQETEKRFRGVLKSFQRLFCNLDSIDLSSRELTRAFAFATDGRLREIRSLLVRSVELAYALPSPRLTMSILSQAFRSAIYADAPPDRNPFEAAFKAVPLTIVGEPFAPVER
ncbi:MULTISPECIES: TniB family NTP-binding protein [unclassified Caballeronia]|uniref:TniB family NTP-binding protein n=1 Tax=unclassified Caballeronia TaxID=2646786 RepID=UPI0020294200|nr:MULTISPECIES: TniB family NTP-binding protein [unclassified Caballeronia]